MKDIVLVGRRVERRKFPNFRINLLKGARICNYFLTHLLLHISLLSLLETLFFFQYASNIEKDVLFSQLRKSINNIKFPEIDLHKYTTEKVSHFLTDLEFDSNDAIAERIRHNNRLFHNSLLSTYVLSALFIISLFFYKCVFQYKLKSLIAEHLIFIIGIGLFEWWFFLNIVIKYYAISSEEINYYLVACFFHKFNLFSSCPL
jgi:hypothetical protein